MRYVYYFLVLALVGCGQPPEQVRHVVSVDAGLAPYFQSFAQDVNTSTAGISGSFVTLTLPTVGECVTYSSGERDIHIDPTYWSTASADSREELMYHELGHCALGLQHIAAVDSTNCPVSIMYPYTFGNSTCYANQKPYYYHELESHK